MSFPYEDQVPRLQAFRSAHPDIRIDNPIDSRSRYWTAHRAGMILCAELELYRLLDELERLLEHDG